MKMEAVWTSETLVCY